MPYGYERHDWFCPYCGHGDSNGNDNYLGEGCHSLNCGNCEKDFMLNVQVQYMFSVVPILPAKTEVPGLYADPLMGRGVIDVNITNAEQIDSPFKVQP